MVAHSEERIFRMAESVTKAGCGTSRAYFIGDGVEGKIEGTDGKSLYHTMAEGSQ